MSFNNLAVKTMSTSKWEDKFKNWSTGPGKAEQERCENAINMIKSAINASEKLKSKSIKVFLQGSYRNKVNVQADSDVDVGIVCSDVFFGDYPKGYNRDSFGYVAASYTFDDFKNDIEEALVEKFGKAAVTRGSKAFDIKANTYRVEADVAPFMEHRRFKVDGSYIIGVQQFSDDGKKVKSILSLCNATRRLNSLRSGFSKPLKFTPIICSPSIFIYNSSALSYCSSF